ncbi:histamine N-methyltransferase-like [Ptychodera flava]|uniref:histamine N-methyltransferase-like n=1 Tax=Ptychodera flava TaxID=63121 RepID=UPI00396A6058
MHNVPYLTHMAGTGLHVIIELTLLRSTLPVHTACAYPEHVRRICETRPSTFFTLKLKMTQDLKALVHFPKEYFEGLQAICRHGYEDYLGQREKDVKDAFESFVFCGETDSTLRVLAVGASDGILDIPIIDTLDSKYRSVLYTVVEPVESQVHEFSALVKSKRERGLWMSTNFDFQLTTIEEFLSKTKTRKELGGFDIIHLQHSAYHLPESVIVELYGQLNKGGMLFTMLVVGAWENNYLRISNIIPDSMLLKFAGSSTLRDTLYRRIPDVKIQTKYRKMRFKADECFKEESKDGNLIVNFLVQLHDFRKTAPPEVVNNYMKYLRECCEELNGELYIPADDEDIVVIKQ